MRTLEERLQEAKDKLDEVVEVLDGNRGTLRPDVDTTLRSKTAFRSDIEHWLMMIESRKAAWGLLDGLEEDVADEMVPFGGSTANFAHVRLIGVQAYVTMQWALADQITKAVGGLLCTPEAGNNLAQPPKLLEDFMGEKRKKTTANVLYGSLRPSFGWPVGVSYVIRNHFVHDGGRMVGSSFFESTSAAAGFRISEDGWLYIKNKVIAKYKLEERFCRPGVRWPPNPRDDLRNVLKFCEGEVDNVLGVIVGAACHVLVGQVGFMVEAQ